MAKRKRARWLWAAWAFTAGGCAKLAGLEDGYYVLEDGSGGAGAGEATGGGTGGVAGTGGSGGAGGGEECTPGGDECVEGTCVEGTCVVLPSCTGLAETCGPNGDESCCSTAEAVPAGRFYRSNDTSYPATVSGFLLDRFEVTVGRFRRFVGAYPGSKPTPGAGAHPRIEGSGWNADWASNLPETAAELTAAVKCHDEYQTWRDTDEGTEHLPMNCLSWYVAFAFCAWDKGRLPTEAEWNYAAAGGDEQREYPWSNPAGSTAIDVSHAVHDCTGDESAPGSCAFSDILPVGSRSPAGDGKWGQADQAGSLWEWVLDGYGDYPEECDDCATTTPTMYHAFRGGGFSLGAPSLLSSGRSYGVPSDYGNGVGVRCARTP
ncbi:formylglycine-generating enzyme family protein [Sorangium sp. So ce426]|uniref:formylglycine-generating enzyme family protein n=1 Tax=Sorangium sp. So ce426 TaxID=3133312 RepID=UPI003F5CB5DA